MGCGASAGSSVTDNKKKDKPSTSGESKEAYVQMGGHEGALKFDGDKITKVCNLEEIENYRNIFPSDKLEDLENEENKTSLEKMAPFVPRFIGADDSGGRGLKPDGNGKCKITLENLLFGRENASFVDIKLGTSTLTIHARS